MRKLLLMCILFILIADVSEAAGKIKLGLVPFSSPDDLTKKAESVTDIFVKVLSASDSITLLNRNRISKTINSDSEAESVSDFGRGEGCKYILLGSVKRDNDTVISVIAVEVQTAKVIFSLSETGSDSDLRAESLRLGEKVRARLTGEYVRVLSVKGRDITINRGSSSGVRKGDFFRIYKEQTEIFDREGNSSGRTQNDLAVVEVVNVKKNSCTARLFKNSNEQIIPSLKGSMAETVSRKDAQTLIRGGNLTAKNIERKTSEGTAITATDWLNPNIFEAVSEGDLKILHKEAEEGYPLAQLRLGTYYLYRRDFPSALKWLQEAAEQGNTDALNGMGYMYANGFGVAQNYQKAFDFYLKAASRGNATAQNNIGSMLIDGTGVMRDLNEAKEWLQKAISQGNAAAMVNISTIYLAEAVRTGKKQDYDTVIKYLRQAAGQDKDKMSSLMAKLNLGTAYTYMLSHADNISDKQEYTMLAREWLNKAVEQAKTERNSNILTKAQEQLNGLSRMAVK